MNFWSSLVKSCFKCCWMLFSFMLHITWQIYKLLFAEFGRPELRSLLCWRPHTDAECDYTCILVVWLYSSLFRNSRHATTYLFLCHSTAEQHRLPQLSAVYSNPHFNQELSYCEVTALTTPTLCSLVAQCWKWVNEFHTFELASRNAISTPVQSICLAYVFYCSLCPCELSLDTLVSSFVLVNG